MNMLDDFRIQIPPRLGILLLDVHTKPPNPNSPGSPPIPISSKFEFSFQPFSRPGTRDTSLSGVPSYLLWYGPDVGEDLAVNSIIVETKEGQSAAGVPQCLAYMGMVHQQRRYENKVNHTIFGLSTDNDQFHFLLISSEGKVREPSVLVNIPRRRHVLIFLLVVSARSELFQPSPGDC